MKWCFVVERNVGGDGRRWWDREENVRRIGNGRWKWRWKIEWAKQIFFIVFFFAILLFDLTSFENTTTSQTGNQRNKDQGNAGNAQNPKQIGRMIIFLTNYNAIRPNRRSRRKADLCIRTGQKLR